MQHYFIEKSHKKEDYFTYTETFNGKTYKMHSVDSVFSKEAFDEGTKVLLNTIIKSYDLSGEVLDVGCGLGTIGIVLKREYPEVSIDMIDVNNTAVELSIKNFPIS